MTTPLQRRSDSAFSPRTVRDRSRSNAWLTLTTREAGRTQGHSELGLSPWSQHVDCTSASIDWYPNQRNPRRTWPRIARRRGARCNGRGEVRDVRVLPSRPGLDDRAPGRPARAPVPLDVGGHVEQFAPVRERQPATLSDEAVRHVHGLRGRRSGGGTRSHARLHKPSVTARGTSGYPSRRVLGDRQRAASTERASSAFPTASNSPSL